MCATVCIKSISTTLRISCSPLTLYLPSNLALMLAVEKLFGRSSGI